MCIPGWVNIDMLHETILVHPTRRHIFARKTDSTFYKIWDLLISEWRISEIICLESRKKSEETSDQVPIYHQLTQLCKSKRPERGSERTVKRRPWTAAPKASIHEVVLVVNGDHQTGLENIAKVHICNLGIFEQKFGGFTTMKSSSFTYFACTCFAFWKASREVVKKNNQN